MRSLLFVVLLGRFSVAFVGAIFICHPVTSLAAVPSGDGSSPRRAIVCKDIEEVYARREPLIKHIANGTSISESSRAETVQAWARKSLAPSLLHHS